MIISIIGMLIGALVAGVGVYYLIKEKQDKESVKIYGNYQRGRRCYFHWNACQADFRTVIVASDL